MFKTRDGRFINLMLLASTISACGSGAGLHSAADSATTGDVSNDAIGDSFDVAQASETSQTPDTGQLPDAGQDPDAGQHPDAGDVGGTDGGCVAVPSGIVGWWPGDGNANDLVGGNDGTLEGGVIFANGRVGQAFLLDGVDDFVDLGNTPTLRISSGDFTVDAWVWFNALQGDMSIVDKMSAQGVNLDGWRLIKQGDNRFWFCFGGGTANHCVDPAFTVFSTTLATSSKWFHVAAVKSSAGFSLYVNGTREDVRSSVPAFVDTNSTNLLIGSYSPQGAHLNGAVDEVEIFNRALTEAEINAIYAAGSAAKCR